MCGLEPDWEATTTVEPPTTTTEPDDDDDDDDDVDDGLPDYNNLDYEFSCEDGFGCMLVAENGFRFYGEEKDGVVTFHSIPYAEPPTGDLRWKAPVLIKKYASEVDAREKGPKCMTRNEKDSEAEGFSEDCLVLKVQVKKTVLESKEKIPVLFYIH